MNSIPLLLVVLVTFIPLISHGLPTITCDWYGCYDCPECKQYCNRIQIYPRYFVSKVCCTFEGKFK